MTLPRDDGALFLTTIGRDFGVNNRRDQIVKTTPLGATSGFLQPVAWRGGGAAEILNTHDHHGRFVDERRGQPAWVVSTIRCQAGAE
jgi:hypothetical protein